MIYIRLVFVIHDSLEVSKYNFGSYPHVQTLSYQE